MFTYLEWTCLCGTAHLRENNDPPLSIVSLWLFSTYWERKKKKVHSSFLIFSLNNLLQEEFQLALFKTNKKESLFADRVTYLFFPL